MSPKVWQRLKIVLLVAVALSAGVGLILYGLRQGIVFFQTPSELIKDTASAKIQVLRLGGLVAKNSIRFSGDDVYFTIVDTDAAIPVVYRGALPALFRAGQGVVAEGHWHPQTGVFKATKLLVKHDENYRPPKPGEKAPVASVIE